MKFVCFFHVTFNFAVTGVNHSLIIRKTVCLLFRPLTIRLNDSRFVILAVSRIFIKFLILHVNKNG